MTNKKKKNIKYPWAIITDSGRIARTPNGRRAIYKTRELARAGNLTICGKVVPRHLALEKPGQFFYRWREIAPCMKLSHFSETWW